MERQVSTATILVIVLVALAAVIGIGFAAFSIAKGSGNDGVQEMAAQTDYASKSKFSEFNDKEVTGLMLKNFMDNNKGNHITFIIQTRTFRNPAKSTSNRNIIMHNQAVYAVYGKQFNVEGNTAYYKIEEGSEIPKWANEAYLLERRDGASLIYKGTFTPNADWDFTSVHSLGTPEYIEDSASFLCNLIYDNGDNIIGIIAKQKNKPGATTKESSVFAADSVLEHINKTDGGNIPLGGLVVWGESGGKQTLIREDGKAGQGFGEVGLSKDKVDTGMYDSIADNAVEEFVFEDLERTILLGYKGTSSQIKIPETVTHVKSLTSDLEGNSLAYKDNLKNVSAIIFNAGCIKIENLDLSLCPNIYSVYVSPTTTVIGGKKLNMVQMEAPRHLKAQIQACREGSVFVNDWDKKLYNCGCPSCQIAEDDWVYVWDGLEIVGYVGTLPKNLEIPLGCTGLGPRALAGGQFETIIIPNSLKYIGQEAFYECKNAQTIDMSACSLITEIPDKTFYNCDGIVSVKLPTSVTKIGNSAFYDCDALTSVFGLCNVESLGNSVFSECAILSSFDNLDKLKTIGKSAFNTTNITFIPKSLESAGTSAFQSTGPSKTYNITIPGSFIEIPQSCFAYCYYIKDVIIEEGVQKIGNSSFSYMSALKNVYIPASVTYIDSKAFVYSPNVTLHFAEGSPFLADGGAVYNEDFTILIKGPSTLTASDTFTIREGCKEIASNAFSNCTLGTLVIPDSVTKIGAGAFTNVKGLLEVTIGKNVKTLGGTLFGTPSSVVTVNLHPDFSPNGWTYSGENFLSQMGSTVKTFNTNGNKYIVEKDGIVYWYSSDKSKCSLVGVLKGTTSATCIDDCKYICTYSLSRSSLVSLNTNNVTHIGWYGLYGASSLSTVETPKVTTLSTRITEGSGVLDIYLPEIETLAQVDVGNGANGGLGYIKNSIKLGPKLKSLPTGAFQGHLTWYKNPVKAIDLSECVLVTRIYAETFSKMSGLATLFLPPNLEIIDEKAFNEISSTCTIELPESLTTVAAGSFANCPKISLKAPKHLKEQNSNDRWGIPNSRITWY